MGHRAPEVGTNKGNCHNRISQIMTVWSDFITYNCVVFEDSHFSSRQGRENQNLLYILYLVFILFLLSGAANQYISKVHKTSL